MIRRRLVQAQDAPNLTAKDEALPPRPEIRRKIWGLTAPALAELVFMTLMNVINMIMVGRLGANAIAAVGLSNQPFFLMNSIFVALNVGSTALIARCVGAEQPLKARQYARQSLIVTIPIGLFFAALAVSVSQPIIYFMGGRGETLRLGTVYFGIVGASLLLVAISSVVFSVLRGAGDTKTPMKISIVVNFLVVFFGWVLIYGNLGFPAMGIVGAGIALLAARVVMAGLCLWELGRPGSVVRVQVRGSYSVDWVSVREVMHIGLPSALEQFVLQGGLIVFVRIVAGLGTEVYAAHQILLSIMGFSFQPGTAFSIAATTLVGQSLGAGNPDLAEFSLREARKMGLSITAFAAVGFVTLGKFLLQLYTDDPQVVAIGASMMVFLALIVPAQTTLLITIGGLRGAGDTRFPLYVSVIGIWGVRVAVAHLLVGQMAMGLTGAWLAMMIDQYIRSALVGYRLSTGRWRSAVSMVAKSETTTV